MTKCQWKNVAGTGLNQQPLVLQSDLLPTALGGPLGLGNKEKSYKISVFQLQKRAEQMKKSLEQQEKEIEDKWKQFEIERKQWEDQTGYSNSLENVKE